jgi:hypothetical protein
MEVSGQLHLPSALPPPPRDPLYRRQGGPQNRSGRVGEDNHCPAGNRSPDVQPVGLSLYWATPYRTENFRWSRHSVAWFEMGSKTWMESRYEFGRRRLWTFLMGYSIRLESLRKVTMKLNHCWRIPVWESNVVPPEYESRTSLLRQTVLCPCVQKISERIKCFTRSFRLQRNVFLMEARTFYRLQNIVTQCL